MVEVRIISLALGIGPIPSAIVLKPIAWDEKQDYSDDLLPIWIGTSEAAAIITYLENNKRSRPLTHDLSSGIIQHLDAKFKWVEICDVSNSTFYADICLETKDGNEILADARPSDAIAYAILNDIPIYVNEEVLAKASIPQQKVLNEQDEFELERFHDFVQNIYPEDFK